MRALIEHFDLQRLPIEGTLFAQTYVSRATTASGDPAGTAIVGLFCNEPRSFSCFHTLEADEVWHAYDGDPFRLILLYPDGSSEDIVMGRNLRAGQRVQFTVPAGVWQAGELIPGGRYALYGSTMAPGFTEAGFKALPAAALVARWPGRMADLQRLSIPERARSGAQCGSGQERVK